MNVRNVKKAGALFAALALAAGGAVVCSDDTADANTINGCYSNSYTTRFSSSCTPAKATAHYFTKAACKAQPDKSAPASYVTKNSTIKGFSSGECTFAVTRATTYAY